ncbi:MAG: TetR/AcrR family transcriptional regulator [Actinomycetota bacterium]|nr:TetR/AcrR family transcriptional regulator [Actinomycetota bacterium]
MPKARPGRERDEKVGEIVAAAIARLRDGGYEQLSVIGIARELGVAQNTIYWYFPSKDHLFVAALQQMFDDIRARKADGGPSVIDRIVWFTEQLRDIWELRAAIEDRAQSSEVVADFAASFHSHLRAMLAKSLRPYVSEQDLDMAVDTYTAAADGVCLMNVPIERWRDILHFTLQRLIGLDPQMAEDQTAVGDNASESRPLSAGSR